MCAIGIESTFTLGASRKRVDEEFSNTTRVNLEVKTPGDGVLPQLNENCSATDHQVHDERTHNRQRLDLRLLPGRKFMIWELQSLRLDAQTGRERMRRCHPDVRMRCIPNLRPHSKALQVGRKDVKHSLPRYERSGA